MWANYNDLTPNGGLVRESPENALNSGLGIIVICPDLLIPMKQPGLAEGFERCSCAPKNHGPNLFWC